MGNGDVGNCVPALGCCDSVLATAKVCDAFACGALHRYPFINPHLALLRIGQLPGMSWVLLATLLGDRANTDGWHTIKEPRNERSSSRISHRHAG